MKVLTVIAALCLLVFAKIHAGNFIVSNTADSGPGSLRQAITDAATANTNGTINFAVTNIITLESTLQVTSKMPLAIIGPGTNLLTISGNNSVQVLVVNANASVTISGLTIADGMATNYENGAGISNSGKLTISNCALINNQNFTGWGGAIFNSGNLNLLNSALIQNQVNGEAGNNCGNLPAAGGGGAGVGGGLFTMNGYVSVIQCIINSNSATGGNGGLGGSTGNGNGKGGGINGALAGAFQRAGSNGGFGGGGGGGGYASNGGDGGFGGGGGGGGSTEAGVPAGGLGSNGGGNGGWGGGIASGSGGGGAGLGGGIFVQSGTVTILNCCFTNNQVIGGLGGADGGGLFGGGANGIGTEPDFFNWGGTIFPILSATTLGGGVLAVSPLVPPYLNNSLATVTASPASGWILVSWLGDASGTNSTVNVSMTRNKTVQAIFATPLTLSTFISAYPQSSLYPYGTLVKLTATPPPGSYFISWLGNASGTNNPTTITVTNSNPYISCQLGTLSLGETSLTVVENGRGHVALFPQKYLYIISDTAGLIPVPDAGQNFIGWSGDATGTNNPLLVSMVESKIIAANFSQQLPSLQVGTPIDGMIDGGFRLTLFGGFGAEYQILNSTNLATWTSLGTVTNAYGESQFLDANGTNEPFGFYRLMQIGP